MVCDWPEKENYRLRVREKCALSHHLAELAQLSRGRSQSHLSRAGRVRKKAGQDVLTLCLESRIRITEDRHSQVTLGCTHGPAKLIKSDRKNSKDSIFLHD